MWRSTTFVQSLSLSLSQSLRGHDVLRGCKRRGATAAAVGVVGGQRRCVVCSHSDKQPEYTPVEDGVTLPGLDGGDGGVAELAEQAKWIEDEVTNWLDIEWPDDAAKQSHCDLSARTAQLYTRLRTEGIDDVGTLLLGIGTALEGEDYSTVYVNGWNIANKLAELLIQRFASPAFVSPKSLDSDHQTVAPTWSIIDDSDAKRQEQDEQDSSSDNIGVERRKRPASPSLADEFERYRFLQMVLDGSATKPLIDGAVAVAMGFDYNRADGTWDGRNVTDSHFKQFGDVPPDVLGDEASGQWTDTLHYLDTQVKDGDDDGRREEGLQVLIETLHGVEMTKIQSNDAKDHAFRKRVAVTKWLHFLGGF